MLIGSKQPGWDALDTEAQYITAVPVGVKAFESPGIPVLQLMRVPMEA